MRTLIATLTLGLALWAAPLHGLVKGAGIPLPGATVTASQAANNATATQTTTTADDGTFTFANLAPGVWTLHVAMTGFIPTDTQVTIPVTGPMPQIALDVAPYHGPALGKAPPPEKAAQTSSAQTQAQSQAAPPSITAADQALAVNGSVDNGAASSFGMSPAFGNARPNVGSLYNGGIGLRYGNSHFDALPYSFTGQDTPGPSYNNLTGLFQIGGPLLIPHLTNLNNAPFFFVAYQKGTALNASTTAALVPTLAQRAMPNMNAQAAALLALYPLPNLTGEPAYNYQADLTGNTHTDALQTRFNRGFGFANQISGSFGFQSLRSNSNTLFGFNDGSSSLGMDVNLGWRHSFTRSLFANFGFDYTRQASQTSPFFANRADIEGNAGILGADTAPDNWGPPSLSFSDGIYPLNDSLYTHNRNQTAAFSAGATWNHINHNVQFGGDYRRLEFNFLSQSNPRGSFTFNGAATGDAFGDFASGIPDAAALNFGNADKYFRQNQYDGYFTDDWRFTDALTLNLGARWEYSAPATELYDRLANLSLTPNFSSAATVTGSQILHPDYADLEPRLGLAWRPLAASSLLIRAGYGIYRDTSVYENLALQMATQAPFATSLSVANSPSTPLTLATAFETPPGSTPDVFAIDPNFRIGYVQTWNASLQRDLPAGMVMTISYLGNKGTRGAQLFYPNTVPPGATNPCSSCPVGFIYETSNGESTYESGKALLQRRFHNGFAATVTYTYAHAIDDSALGGGANSGPNASNRVVAQNWLDLDAERARSDFDQRHNLAVVAQYSTGNGVRGGALMRGWHGALFKGWTITTNLTAGSGLPLTPLTLDVIPGTGFTGVRPNAAGSGTGGPDGFTAPTPGDWGTAGRNSVNGPSQFSLNASMQRSFPLPHSLTAALRFDVTNLLNHVSFTGLNPLFGSPQFLLPDAANPMRSLQTTLRITW